MLTASPFARFGVLALACVLGSALAAPASAGGSLASSAPAFDGCKITFEPDPFPGLVVDSYSIGWSFGTSYSAVDVVAVEPVPLGIEATDIDRMLLYCDALCVEWFYPSTFDVDWSVTTTGGAKPGAFLSAAAMEVVTFASHTHALYLPPSDLGLGQSRTCTITARVFDDCGGADDPDATVTFSAIVTRRPTGRFDVTVSHLTTVVPFLQPEPCEQNDQLCELLGPWFNINPAPSVSVSSQPTGMVVGEVRPIDCAPLDLDTIGIECGTPPGHSPVVSNFDDTQICDDMTFDWSVLPVAGETGNGLFLNQHRTTLFRATHPGKITVQVRITTTDSEIATATCKFEIHALRLESLSFGGGHDVARDADATVYAAPHWLDGNDDGDAVDVAIDRRFPAAYTQNTKVVVDEILVDCGVKPMPGAKFRGTGPDADIFEGGAVALLGGQPADYLRGAALTSTNELPQAVKKYEPYSVAWEIDFGGAAWTPAGTTENWIYVTLAAAVAGFPYPKFESVYDISCKAADGANTPFAMAALVYGDFASLNVTRKSRDGDNETDGTWLRYWLPAESAEQTIDLMLAHPNGTGTCLAWSQLLRACLGIHGEASTVTEVLPPPPAGFLLVKNWKQQTGNFLCVGADGVSQSATAGDDVLEIPIGQGMPWSVGVTSPLGALLVTPAVLDDYAVGAGNPDGVVLTGANGICNSAAVAPDIQAIPVGNGRPHLAPNPPHEPGSPHPVCVSAGADGVLVSAPVGDDHVQPLAVGGPLIYGFHVVNAPGVPGQGNPEPPPVFGNHFVVAYLGFIADPSYGTLFAATAAHDDASFFGFLATPNVTLNPAGLDCAYNPTAF
jgi:hypothetical protein